MKQNVLTGKRAIIVLGMHRSGTSALSRGLRALGVQLGEEQHLDPANEENARGYWERKDIVALNDELLEAMGANWHAVWLPPLATLSPQTLAGFTKKAVSLLERGFGTASIFGFKDPRVCRLLPFWQHVFGTLDIIDEYVIALRNPLNVALSLQKRDRLPIEMGCWLWLQHMLPVVRLTAGKSAIVADYDLLLENPRHELTRIAEHFGLPVTVEVNASIEEFARGFIDENLRHHSASDDSLRENPRIPELVSEAFFALRGLATDGATFADASFIETWGQIASTASARSGTVGAHDTNPMAPADVAKTCPQVEEKGGTTRRVAIIVHLFHANLWPEIIELLDQAKFSFDLFVTVPNDRGEALSALVQANYPVARVIPVENRGRDILSFLTVLPDLIHGGYLCACKLHTKKSEYENIDGTMWRRDLLRKLLGNTAITTDIIARFAAIPRVGMIGPRGHYLSAGEYLDSRQERIFSLAEKLLSGSSHQDWRFFAGSMFWFRPVAFLPLLQLGLTREDFEPETGQKEGTLAHAIERLFTISAAAAGFDVEETASSDDISVNEAISYPFAKQSASMLLSEVQGLTKQLSQTEAALAHASELAISRLEQLDAIRTTWVWRWARKLRLVRD